LHGIYAADQDKHLHNHPWDYFSLILKGTYLEETENGINTMSPGSYAKRDGTKFHKIQKLLTPVVYSLFISSKPKREWGYKVNDEFVQHEKYRELKNSNKL